MSYYNHPYFSHQHPHRRSAVPASFAPYHPHPSPYGYDLEDYPRPFAPQHIRHPTPPQPELNLEDEEAAALAHLRSIQRRKEQAAQNAAIQAEAEALARARVQAEREAAIRSLVEKEQQRAAAIAAQRQRQAGIIAARSQAEAEKRARAAQAWHEKKREYLAALQGEQARDIEGCRRACAAKQTRARNEGQRFDPTQLNGILGSLFGINAVPENETAAQPQTPARSSPIVEAASKFDPTQLNGILGPLFGININSEAGSTETANPAPVQPQSESAPAQSSTPASAPAPAEEKTTEQHTIPKEINDLLSHFLGLRVEPYNESSDSTATSEGVKNGVPQGLNEFLGRYGLEFQPLDTEAAESKEVSGPSESQATQAGPSVPEVKVTPTKSSTPTESAPAPSPTPAASSAEPSQSKSAPKAPITNFFGQHTSIPPFLRDLLENFEEAILEDVKERSKTDFGGVKEEEIKGKGKGVAEGEKKATPAPAPVSPSVPIPAPVTPTPAPAITTEVVPTPEEVQQTSTRALNKIETQLETLQSSFNFPPTLSFSTSTSPDTPPALLFNRQNSIYHHQANSLLQLLLALDGVSSGGDKEVRSRRKELVKKVENALEELEKGRDQVWEVVRARREAGEVEVEDEGHSSETETSSVVDHLELREEPVVVENEEIKAQQAEAEVDSQEQAEPQPTESASSDESTGAEKDVEGYQVDTTGTGIESQVIPETKVDGKHIVQVADEAEEKKQEIDNEYEML